MKNYLYWLAQLYEYGAENSDRTGVGTKSLFGVKMNFTLRDGFPLVTTRQIRFKSIVDELLWFISGSTNVNDLPKRTQHWWRPWAFPNGDLGPVYGKQLRDFNGIDQLQETIDNLIINPGSRRHVITLWNPPEIDKMALPPCHGIVIQFYVRYGIYLDCQMYIRSNDWFLGCPTNIASYALLTHMVAQVTGNIPGELHYVVGDAHLYLNHTKPAKIQLARAPRPLPKLLLNDNVENIDDFTVEDIRLLDYYPHPHIPAKIAV